MKNLRKLFALIAVVSFAAISCSTCDDEVDEVIEEGQKVFSIDGSWSCMSGESCQDVYEIEFKNFSSVSIRVYGITGMSVAQIAVYDPNNDLGEINILTGSNKELSCGGQNESETVVNQTINEGVYKIAITRDWGESAGSSGDYALTITSTEKMKNISQIIDNVESLATESICFE